MAWTEIELQQFSSSHLPLAVLPPAVLSFRALCSSVRRQIINRAHQNGETFDSLSSLEQLKLNLLHLWALRLLLLLKLTLGQLSWTFQVKCK